MGKSFGKLFGSVSHVCASCSVFEPSLTSSAGHYRLWMNGIHHGDISFNNLMYDTSATNGPVGILNDFDLATWVDHSTTNNDRTGTIPFMAIDMLDGGLDDRIPRLYRHDLESFVWVLSYITVAKIEYKNHTIEISPLSGVEAWFKDDDQADRKAHISSKRLLHLEYGRDTQPVSGRYHRYIDIVQRMTLYWVNFHQSLRTGGYGSPPPGPPIPESSRGERVLNKPEGDGPTRSLELFIKTVETSLGESYVGEGFGEIRTLLLEAIGTQTDAVSAV